MTRSPVVDFLDGRERVLGRRTSVSDDPDLAADQLAEHYGSIVLARRWLLDVLDALTRRSR